MIATLDRPLPTTSAPAGFTHIVTLIHPRTSQEACLVVTTPTERFCDVLLAVKIQRALHGLAGFEIFEALPCNGAPF